MKHDDIFENSRLVCTPHAKGDEDLLRLLRQVYMAGAFSVKRHYEQKLNIASVSAKRPSRKLFCKVWTQVFGEEIDNVNQLVYGKAALGEELYELCLKFHKAACASGAVDTVAARGFYCWELDCKNELCKEQCSDCKTKIV